MRYDQSSDSSTYHAEILYSFTVDGEPRSGNRIAFGDYGSSNPSHAQEIVNRYPVGKAVRVSYLPGQPDVCLLEPGLHGQGVGRSRRRPGFLHRRNRHGHFSAKRAQKALQRLTTLHGCAVIISFGFNM